MSVFQKFQRLLCEHLGLRLEEVKDDVSIVNDLGADSLDILEITMACEIEFDILIDDEEIYKLNTVSDLVNFISKKIENK